MFAQKGLFSSIGRAAVMATVAAMALTAFEPSVARAGSAPAGVSAKTASSDATDFSARRRHYGGGGAAAAAAFAGIVGTGLAIAASQNRYGYYDDSYAYYGGGYPVYGGPAYYGGGPAYYGSGDCYVGNPCYGGHRPYGAPGRYFPVP